MPERLFITGCARSGTTLLRRLCYAFEGVEVIDSEVALADFATRASDAPFLVGKRTKYSLLAADIGAEATEAALDVLDRTGVKVLCILRDGRDVIASRENATPERWLACWQAWHAHRARVAVTVCYERLVTMPDVVQAELAARLGLTPRARFSEYPSFVPPSGFVEGARYTPRPVAADKVGKAYDWRALVPEALQVEFEAACLAYQTEVLAC